MPSEPEEFHESMIQSDWPVIVTLSETWKPPKGQPVSTVFNTDTVPHEMIKHLLSDRPLGRGI